MIVARKGDQDHKYQRYDGEAQNAENRKAHQHGMEVFLLQGSDVVPESRNGTSLLLPLLRAKGTFCRHKRHKYHERGYYQCNNSIQQAEHGIVACGIFIISQSLIVHLPLLHGAKSHKIPQRADTEPNHKDNIQYLNG